MTATVDRIALLETSLVQETMRADAAEAALKTARGDCAKAVCQYCAAGFRRLWVEGQTLIHEINGNRASCQAEAIHALETARD